MKVVIVSRTRMHSGVCVGGLTRDDLRNVRLLTGSGEHSQPVDAPYQIGEVWEMELREPESVTPPHIEDMLVGNARRVAVQTSLPDWLGKSVVPWEGDASTLFGGLLHVSSGNTAYIAHDRLPPGSVGFWRPTVDLKLEESHGSRYLAPFRDREIHVAYVGVAEPARLVPAGSLVRVSLARWFAPGGDGFEACWLQLSGWYPA